LVDHLAALSPEVAKALGMPSNIVAVVVAVPAARTVAGAAATTSAMTTIAADAVIMAAVGVDTMEHHFMVDFHSARITAPMDITTTTAIGIHTPDAWRRGATDGRRDR
jgi:hypothetical protein